MHAPGNEEQLKRLKVEVPANEVPSRTDVSVESECGSPILEPESTIDSLEEALSLLELHDAFNQVHLVEVDREHTTWVIPNLARERPFTEAEHARLTSAVVFRDERAWASFTDDDILVFHSN